MDKLIALLDEYEGPELEHTIIDGNVKRRVKNIVEPDKPYKWSSVWWYSKSFGFIKWLVENDKIDWSKYGYSIEYTKSREGMLPLHRTVKRGDSIIMWMSIIEKPLEFLVSILK